MYFHLVPALEVRDGQLVAIHRDGDLRRHAARLAAIAGAGAPPVVTWTEAPSAELVLAVLPPLRCEGVTATDAARVAAQCADVLARAHHAGIAHGPMRPEHVQGSAERVLLGGWEGGHDVDPLDDVAELGDLIDRLAPGHRGLHAIATRAQAPDRPTATAIGDALRAFLDDENRPRRRVDRRVVVAIGGLACAVVAAVVLARSPSSAARAGEQPPASSPPSTRQLGNLVERDGQQLRIGRAGDVVVEGRFDCHDVAPALLRPSTGQVWVFPSWHARAGRLVATRRGATSLGVRQVDGCDRLEVRDGQGRWRAVG